MNLNQKLRIASKFKMRRKSEDQIINEVKDLFEIKIKKIDLKSKISKYFQLDSLNQLKLMGLIDENRKKKINLIEISKIKTFKDIIKLIND